MLLRRRGGPSPRRRLIVVLLNALGLTEAFFPWAPSCTARVSSADSDACFAGCGRGLGFATLRGFQEELNDVLEAAELMVPIVDDGQTSKEAYAIWADLLSKGSLWDLRVEVSQTKLWILVSNLVLVKHLKSDAGECDTLLSALTLFYDFHRFWMSLVRLIDPEKRDHATLAKSVRWLENGVLQDAIENTSWRFLLGSGWPVFLMALRMSQNVRGAFSWVKVSVEAPGETEASRSARARGVAAAHALLDAALRAVPRPPPINVTSSRAAAPDVSLERVWRLLAKAQEAYREARLDGGESWSHALVVHRETFVKLCNLQTAVGTFLAWSGRSLRFGLDADVQVVFCGLGVHVQALVALARARGWGLRTWAVPSPRHCGLRDAAGGWLADVADAARRAGRAVLLVSPWTERVHEEALVGLLAALRPGRVELVGAPTSNAAGLWWWPARVLRRRHWRATFSVPPGGNTGSDKGKCFAADTTSGTRAYTPRLLRRLLVDGPGGKAADWAARGRPGAALGAPSDVSLLMELDLRASELGVRAYTCWLGRALLVEADYLQHADLFRAAALRRGLEVLQTPNAPERRLCIVYDSWTGELLSIARGLSMPPCHLEALAGAHRGLVSWWSSQGPGRFASLDRSSALSAVRGGIFPWQGDVEVSLHAPHEDVTGDAERLHNFAASQRNVDDNPWRRYCKSPSRCYVVARVALPDGHLVNAEVRFWGSSREADFPLTVEIAGATFRMSMSELDETVQWYKPQRALRLNASFGLVPMHCSDVGHNACLPHCNATWCEA